MKSKYQYLLSIFINFIPFNCKYNTMANQDAASYALVIFRKTYSKPEDIVKVFKGSLKKKVTYLSLQSGESRNMDAAINDFAWEIFCQINFVSLNIIQSRLTDDVIRDLGLHNAVAKDKATNRYFKKLAKELMNALINMVYVDKKVVNRKQKSLAGFPRQVPNL